MQKKNKKYQPFRKRSLQTNANRLRCLQSDYIYSHYIDCLQSVICNNKSNSVLLKLEFFKGHLVDLYLKKVKTFNTA